MRGRGHQAADGDDHIASKQGFDQPDLTIASKMAILQHQNLLPLANEIFTSATPIPSMVEIGASPWPHKSEPP